MDDSNERTVKIMLIEDFVVDIGGITNLLEAAGFSLTDEYICRSRVEAESALKTVSPDLVFVDLELPQELGERARVEVGLGLVIYIKAIYPSLRVVAIARLARPHHIYRLLTAGVSLYTKSNLETPEIILKLIVGVMEGEVIYSPSAAPLLREACKSAVKLKFDDMDIKIIRRVLENRTDVEIGEDVGLTDEAVGKRLSNLYKRVGLHNRTKLAKWFENYVVPAYDLNFYNQ